MNSKMFVYCIFQSIGLQPATDDTVLPKPHNKTCHLFADAHIVQVLETAVLIHRVVSFFEA